MSRDNYHNFNKITLKMILELTHNPLDIFALKDHKIALSCPLRKIKKVLNFHYNKDFISYCKNNNLTFKITDLQVTKFDFDKSFLDVLSPFVTKNQLKEIKETPTIVVLENEKLKASSHLLIASRNYLENNEIKSLT